MDDAGPAQAEAPLPPVVSNPDADLGRLRVLQILSIALMSAGVVLPAGVLIANPELLSGGISGVADLFGAAVVFLLGILAFIAGLLMNAVRALVVRRPLPPDRYRGPAVIVLLLLALVVASILSLGAGSDAVALVNGGPLTVGGTLLLLTSTQTGLLVTAGAFVVLPRALAGLRLVPPGGALRSAAIGLALALPAWIAATVLSLVASRLLEWAGFAQEVGLPDRVLERGDPTVILVAFLVVAPIAEEFFFRAIVYNAWQRERGARVALYGSAALFAGIHGSLFAFVPIFVLGIALALVYRSTRSLASSIALHAGFNAISVVLALLARLDLIRLPT